MTLERAEVNVSGVFDFGQMYVAISRLRSLAGLRLIGFDSSRLHVNPDVMEFYRGLGMVRKAMPSTDSKAPVASLPSTMPLSKPLPLSLPVGPRAMVAKEETKVVLPTINATSIDDDINAIIQTHRDKQRQGTKRKFDSGDDGKHEMFKKTKLNDCID